MERPKIILGTFGIWCEQLLDIMGKELERVDKVIFNREDVVYTASQGSIRDLSSFPVVAWCFIRLPMTIAIMLTRTAH
jgi:hypothetical protein